MRSSHVVFLVFGAAGASWATRIPALRDHLALSPAQLGLVLLSIAVGAMVSLPLSGVVVDRLGPARTVSTMAVLLTVGLSVVSVGYLFGVVPVVAGFATIGVANGMWDVGMNVHAGHVEHRLQRPLLARFHAMFSVGTVLGALAGAGAVAVGLSITQHLVLVALITVATVPLATRRFLPAHEPDEHAQSAGEGSLGAVSRRGEQLRRWREPRTLLIGVLVLASAFSEGAGVDWIGVATIDDHHANPTSATLALATFLAATTLTRWFASSWVQRFGRVRMLRAASLAAVVGVVLFVFAPTGALAFAGVAVWGAGVALGFPVGMSAATDDPRAAATRLSVVASVGYTGFLLGPPVIGLIADQTSVLGALLTVAVLMVVAAVVSSATSPLTAREPTQMARTGCAPGTGGSPASGSRGEGAS